MMSSIGAPCPAPHGVRKNVERHCIPGGDKAAETRRRTRAGSQLTITEHEVLLTDQFIDDRFDATNKEVARLAEIGNTYHGGTDADAVKRKRTSRPDLSNPATRELIDTYPSFASWLSTVPTAAALHPLYAPDEPLLPDGTAIDGPSAAWFRNIADARCIRSRASVMKRVLTQEAHGPGQAKTWLSLACGAAQPVLAVLEDLRPQATPLPHVTLADIDNRALGLAQRYADQRGLSSQVSTKRLNVLRRNGLAGGRRPVISPLAKIVSPAHRRLLPPESFDAVDAVGILEYLKRPDWKYTYEGVISTTHRMAGADTFLRNAFHLVKPDGLLLVGNMLDTHPQLDFTLNVIQWPHIQPRSIEEIAGILTGAGIEGHVDVHKPQDGVYALYAIRKN